MPHVSLRFGTVFYNGDYGSSSDGDAVAYLCDSAEAMDHAMRSVFRVRHWKLTIGYSRESGTINGDGDFESASSSPVTTEFNSQQITTDTSSLISDESQVITPGVSHGWTTPDGGADGCNAAFNLELQYNFALEGWTLPFTFLLSGYEVTITTNDGHDASISIVSGTPGLSGGGDTDELLTFLEQTWEVTNYSRVVGTASAADPDDHSAVRITLSSFKLDPQEYWSYGGRYNTGTGALS